MEILDHPYLEAGGDFVREMVRFLREIGLHYQSKSVIILSSK